MERVHNSQRPAGVAGQLGWIDLIWCHIINILAVMILTSVFIDLAKLIVKRLRRVGVASLAYFPGDFAEPISDEKAA